MSLHCPHCGEEVLERSANAEKRWFYLKKLLSEFYDESSPIGKAVMQILAAVGELQSMYQSQKIKEALAQRRKDGVRLGRPNVRIDQETAATILLHAKTLRRRFSCAGKS